MGKSSGGDGGGKAAKLQAEIAEQLFNETGPLRGELLGRSEDFLSGGADPTKTPTYQAAQGAYGRNFNQAKDNTIARFAPGGGLIDAITDLESARSTGLSQTSANIYDQELNRATGLGTGQLNVAMGGLGNAANTQAMIAQANASQNAGKAGGLGQGVGAYFGSK